MTVKPTALPYKEAEKFWEDKIKLSPGQYSKLSDEAKLRAFAVSGIAKQAELETVFGSLQKAITDGTTFADFQKDCGDIFEKRGWTGVRAWRVDNIFRTNIQTAYMTGRYKQMKAAAALRPYWQYSAVNDKRTRPTHAAIHEVVYPADHPFWDTWYPPNGFRCRCTMKSLSARQVEKRGLKIETKDITGTLVEPIDPETGNKMPARLLMPDPGFKYNPGKAVHGGLAPAEGEGGYEDMGKRTYKDFRRRKIDNLPKEAYAGFADKDLLPGAEEMKQLKNLSGKKAQQFYLDEFLKEFGISSGETKIFTDAIGEPLVIGEDLFRTAAGNLKITKRGRERYLKLLAKTIQDPYEVWLVPQRNKNDGRVVLRRRYIRAFSTGPENKLSGFVAFDYGSSGWGGVTAFAPDTLDYADKLRNGILLHGK
ncbi:MAG: PBECR2 nuclease fold domain-containing protein [Pseudomonadota bacterium]